MSQAHGSFVKIHLLYVLPHFFRQEVAHVAAFPDAFPDEGG